MEAKNQEFLTDTHTHLGSSKFAGKRAEVVSRAEENGVRRMISIACDLEDSRENVGFSQRFDSVFGTAGVHPTYIHEIDGSRHFQNDSEWLDEIRELSRGKKICAIGEIGLDYFHPPQDGSEESVWRSRQREVFEQLLQLSIEEDLPTVIHQRNCSEDIFPVLANFPKAKAVLHCFGGTTKEAEAALELGHYLSFTGILTFPKAEEVREVARIIPLDRVMVETDAPYLAPVPFRGKQCEPFMVKHTAAELARVHDLEDSEMAKITSKNACDFFKLPTLS